jgi:Carboxypeptidase regulatory-like domain
MRRRFFLNQRLPLHRQERNMHSDCRLPKFPPFSRLALTVLLSVPVILAGTRASGQVDRAVLEGTVTDPSRSVIVGATLKVLAAATGITEEQKTNSKGYYRFPGLAVGQYKVTVAGTGFKTKVVEDVQLRVGETHTLDVELAVGGIQEQVEVKASNEPADRTSAEESEVIDTNRIANLPVNGRDWSSLTMLAPFAQDDGGGNQRTIRYAGRAIDDNNFNFDGVDAGGIQEQAQKSQVRLQISEDAISEYRVNSALYDAEYGTQAGAQVNVLTKSGTNAYHGTVFGYLRNSVFDARNFTDYDLNGNPAIPPFRLGQYGLTFGGPIKKDNTFFFLSFEGLRQFQTTSQIGVVPNAGLVKDILVNGRGGEGPSPQMCSILQAYPWRASTGTVGTCTPTRVFPDGAFTSNGDADDENFTHGTPTTIHEDTALVRIDHKFSESTTLYGRAQRDILHYDAPISPLFDKQQIYNHPANYFIALQHAFTGTLFNEFKVYVNRSPYHNPQVSVLPYAVSTNLNITAINNNSEDVEVGTTFGFIDNFTWTRGRHTFKTGMEIRRVRLNQGQTSNNTLSFDTAQTMVSATLASVSYIAPWCCHKYRRTFYMPYFQDEWKVTPTFTANLGLRWEYYGVAHVPDNRTTVFDFDQFHGACLGSGSLNTPFPAPINTPPCPQNPSLYNPDYRNFDPRVSFAWAPSRMHGKTVIRSGFGIYHGAAQNDDLNAGLESDTFRAGINQNTPLTPALEQQDPDLSGLSGSTKVANHPRALQRHGRRDLYSESWGLTIERALPSGFQFTTSYLGSHGVRLFSRGAVNLCNIPVTFNSTGDCNRPLDQYFTDPANPDPYGSVDYKHDVGQSTYHGLLVSLEHRLSNGLSFETRYTLAHSINDGAVGGGESNGPENVNCQRCDKGPSVFDVRHNFTTNAVYELPFGPGKEFLNGGGALGKIVGGWELSGIGTFHTGHPLTVTMNLKGSDNFRLPDGNDQTTQRPDLIPGVPLYLPGGVQYVPGGNGATTSLLNPAAFQAPPLDSNGNFTHFGTAPNGVGRAINIWQVDFALTKETKLTERVEMEFAVQAFNIFNHVQLGDPSTSLDFDLGNQNGGTGNLSSGSFGSITSTVNGLGTNTGTGLARQLQFMMRFKF